MAKKPSIVVPLSLPPDTRVFADAVKEWVEVVQGLRGDAKVAKLPATASLGDVIAKVNELIDLLQG